MGNVGQVLQQQGTLAQGLSLAGNGQGMGIQVANAPLRPTVALALPQQVAASEGTWQGGGQYISGGMVQEQGRQAAQLQYDEAAAEQQVTKVQAAQEVTVAKTVPLRLNLPKRGVYLAFTQVLQTEPGKPMTVSFRASNDRAASLPVQAATGVAGFLALWVWSGWLTIAASERQCLTSLCNQIPHRHSAPC